MYVQAIEARFLHASFVQGLSALLEDRWITNAEPEDLPGRILASAEQGPGEKGTRERLVALDGSAVRVSYQAQGVNVRIAATDQESAQATLKTLREKLPEIENERTDEIPLRLWWWHRGEAREMARTVSVPHWPEIAGNYSRSAAATVTDLIAWREPPSSGGRLVLWHGEPGTGKTTAIRALAGAWRPWADFHFVTDPEAFLTNSNYLLNIIGDDPFRSPAARRAKAEKWQVVVLEDAGEFLAPDAKRATGQALSRLLNVSDGVLGQATRTLVLITTNGPLKSLHSALSRPGRCLSEIHFSPLDEAEIKRWAGENQVAMPDRRRATIAELYGLVEGRSIPVEQQFGFAAANDRGEVSEAA